jgi:ribosome biogenesis GTPase
MGLIEEILPRRSDVARWKGGARGERQTLAANVDLVIVVQQMGETEADYARVARSAVVVRDCGARLAVVLSKADRAGEQGVARDVAALREVLGDELQLVVTSAAADGDASTPSAAELARACEAVGVPYGTEAVRALVPEGTIAIVLGESGAGKSTLLNALLGSQVLETGAVRASDDAGRHTTVARRMVALPGAGVIVDEPGLRSLPLVGHERGLAQVFPDVAAQARACRFRDCTHTHEPGCAVLAHAQDEGYAGRRLEAYLALAREMRASRQSLDPDVVI